MRPHPRIRKTIKWGGAALTALLVVVWIGSGWYYASCGYVYQDSSGQRYATGAVLHRGRFCLHHGQQAESIVPTGWHIVAERYEYEISNWPPVIAWRYSTPTIGVAFWLLALVSALATVIAFRLDTLARRRARMNLCPKCHYDRTGLASDAVCPECGTGSGTA